MPSDLDPTPEVEGARERRRCSAEQELPRQWLTGLAKFGRLGVESSGLWPGMEYVACVIHLGLVRGVGRLGATCAKAVAGLHGGARRRGEFGRFWCGNLDAKVS